MATGGAPFFASASRISSSRISGSGRLGRWRRVCVLQAVDRAYYQKKYKGDDEKIDRDCQKIAPADNGALLLRLREHRRRDWRKAKSTTLPHGEFVDLRELFSLPSIPAKPISTPNGAKPSEMGPMRMPHSWRPTPSAELGRNRPLHAGRCASPL